MTHEGLSNFLYYSGFHQSCVERVPEIVESVIADTCSTDRVFPSGLDGVNGFVVEREDEAFGFDPRGEQLLQPARERDFPSLTPGGFRVSDL